MRAESQSNYIMRKKWLERIRKTKKEMVGGINEIIVGRKVKRGNT